MKIRLIVNKETNEGIPERRVQGKKTRRGLRRRGEKRVCFERSGGSGEVYRTRGQKSRCPGAKANKE